ncbi:MAG: tetratricopeptide repeat protein [Pseudolabrys sp.]
MPRALAIACLGFWLAGCSLTDKLGSDALSVKSDGADAFAAVPAEPAQAEVAGTPAGPASTLLGSDPNDDLGTGKKFFRAGNYGMAERHFRRAVELHPRDAEAWLCLAAAYDRLRRFDLADRAYAQATGLVGPTVEILNNEGYSYMLRGDYARARSKLAAAQRKDPGNKFVQNNLQLLAASMRTAKQVE